MKKVLVTGAGGFIGGRLVEVLKEQGWGVNVLLRTISKGARISPYSLNYFKGNITDRQALEKAMEGCDAMVHCAHDFSNPEENLRAAELIASLCLQKGIKKLVYISSFAVHQTGKGEWIGESTPFTNDWDYGVNKARVEASLLHYHQAAQLPVVILRPTIVYGPFAGAWTVGIVNQMLENRMVLPYEGKRCCNAVYIDDVVGAIIQALQSGDQCNGKAYLVSGPDTVTWYDFFKSYERYEGVQEVVLMNVSESEEWNNSYQSGVQKEAKANIGQDPIAFLKKTPVYTLYQKLLQNNAVRKSLLAAKTNIPRPMLYPTKESFDMMSCTGKVNLERMRTELGYEPRFHFSAGMEQTLAFLNWSNLNCN